MLVALRAEESLRIGHINASNAIFDAGKEKYATSNGKPNILIDDSVSNIRKWEAAGGIGIRYQADKDDLSVVVNGLKSAVQQING